MKEIPLHLLFKTITLKRLLNAGLAIASFLLSAVTGKRRSWGNPFILTVEPTNICNLKCPLCVTGNGKMTRKAGKLDLQTYKRIINTVGDSVFYLLLYQQGEPFINRDFLSFVRYAKERRIFVTTSTNAHYFTPEVARETVASGLDSLIVSVDGADQQTYETYRVAGDLERVKQGIQNLVREKKRQRKRTPVIYLQFIVMRQNENQIAEMEKMARQLGVDKFIKKTVQVETINEARDWLPENAGLSRYYYGAERDALVPKRTGKGPCSRPWTSTLINCEGAVVPCCFDKNGQYSFGKIEQNFDVKDAWQSQKYDHFREQMLTDRGALDICSNCSQGLRLFI